MPDDAQPDPPEADPPPDLEEFTDKVELRLVPAEPVNASLIRELEARFREAARLALCIPPAAPLRPVKDDEGIRLRTVLDQKGEEIRERAAKAEPRAAELRAKVAEHGESATAAEVAAARERIIRLVRELRENHGLIAGARADTGEPGE